MTANPYMRLPGAALWKNAAGAADADVLPDLWSPRFPITRTTRILTAGSCFAQHISRALVKSGFTWVDSEPAPATVDPAEATADGYGVFSFRTGNIYTPALLKQWIEMALGRSAPPDEVFVADGR
jgi:hypothetical protein